MTLIGLISCIRDRDSGLMLWSGVHTRSDKAFTGSRKFLTVRACKNQFHQKNVLSISRLQYFADQHSFPADAVNLLKSRVMYMCLEWSGNEMLSTKSIGNIFYDATIDLGTRGQVIAPGHQIDLLTLFWLLSGPSSISTCFLRRVAYPTGQKFPSRYASNLRQNLSGSNVWATSIYTDSQIGFGVFSAFAHEFLGRKLVYSCYRCFEGFLFHPKSHLIPDVCFNS